MKMAMFDELVDRVGAEFPGLDPKKIGEYIRLLTAPEGMDNCEDAYFFEGLPGSTASLWILSEAEIRDITETGMLWVNVWAGGRTQPPISAFTRWAGDDEPLYTAGGPAEWREMVEEAHQRFVREALDMPFIVMDGGERVGRGK